MEYYLYVHKELEFPNKVFYVGKGKDYRYKDGGRRHKEWHKNTPNGFLYELLAEGLSNKESLEIEKELIDLIGIENLCNVSRKGVKRPDVALRNKTRLNTGKKYKEHKRNRI